MWLTDFLKYFFVLFYCVSWRFDFRIVVSITISTSKSQKIQFVKDSKNLVIKPWTAIR
jgi:hypothetical protein